MKKEKIIFLDQVRDVIIIPNEEIPEFKSEKECTDFTNSFDGYQFFSMDREQGITLIKKNI